MIRRRINVADPSGFRPHDHAAWFGDGAAELYSVAVSALAEGARRNERLVFVADDPRPELLSGLGDVERLLADRQLELVPVDAAYGADWSFSPSARLASSEAFLADALASGYTGIRTVADTTSLVQGSEESFHRWLAWEQMADHVHAASRFTGICFFDTSAVSPQRQADVAALHPVRAATEFQPPLSLFVDGDAIFLIGALDAAPTDQLRRLLTTIDFDRRPILDLTAAKLAGGSALYVLADFATEAQPLRVRGTGHLHELLASMGPALAHLRIEPNGPAVRCAGCGDVIGAYEPTIVIVDGKPSPGSRLDQAGASATADVSYHQACYVD